MFRKARFSCVHLPGASSVMVSTCTVNARVMFTSAPHNLRPSHQRSYEELLRKPRNSASATPTRVNGVAFSGTLCLKIVPSDQTANTLNAATISSCGSICFIIEPRHTNSRVHQLVFDRTIIGSSGQKNGGQRHLTLPPLCGPIRNRAIEFSSGDHLRLEWTLGL